jgi:alpha-tubulin suppressor-like RCC1 family protein
VGDNDDYVTPQRLASFGNVRAIAVGGAHTLAVRGDGTVFSWGRSDFVSPTATVVQSHTRPIDPAYNACTCAAAH